MKLRTSYLPLLPSPFRYSNTEHMRYWPRVILANIFFFLVFVERDGVDVYINAKKTRPISSHLD